MFKWIILPFPDKNSFSFSHQKPDRKLSDVLKCSGSPQRSSCCEIFPMWGWRHMGKSHSGREGAWLEHRSQQARAFSPAGRISHGYNIRRLWPANSHEDSQLQGATEVSVKIIKPLQLVAWKLMMKFQVSLPSIYSLYLRRICCIYKGGDQMIKSNRLFPSLRLLWSLSTHKIEAWFGSPKYLVCHVSFSSKWT